MTQEVAQGPGVGLERVAWPGNQARQKLLGRAMGHPHIEPVVQVSAHGPGDQDGEFAGLVRLDQGPGSLELVKRNLERQPGPYRRTSPEVDPARDQSTEHQRGGP